MYTYTLHVPSQVVLEVGISIMLGTFICRHYYLPYGKLAITYSTYGSAHGGSEQTSCYLRDEMRGFLMVYTVF